MIIGTERRDCIRAVFLNRAESYGLCEVARLIQIPPDRLRRATAKGDRDAYKLGRVWRFTWRQLAFLAVDRWTLAEIHEALGNDAPRVLPPLLSLRRVTVRLPEFIVRALETVAAESGVTLDDALHGELIDFAGTMAGRMEKTVTGYRRAYFFPGESPHDEVTDQEDRVRNRDPRN